MTLTDGVDLGHQIQIGESWRADHPVHGAAVFTPFTCTCLNYSNLVAQKTVHKAWREARRVHQMHADKMHEEQ
jgi:hypothetical protein